MFALRLQLEEMIKRRDAINAAGGEFQLAGDEQQQVVFEVAKKFLSLVQNLDECIVPELMLLHVRFKDFEALVAAGVQDHARDVFFLFL